MELLDEIQRPEDIKKLPREKLPQLMEEVRQRIISVTLRNGGHIASSLGAVELITALLRTFDPENDKVVFDVGHQAYAWKILTGRGKEFGTLRTEGGISGFPKLSESPCDHFGTGHSSTSLSAALGYAEARDLQGQNHCVAAVIGDGSIINGEAFEALNHAGVLDTRVIFVLNDNNMSISPRVGGMALHLARLSTSRLYKRAKSTVKFLCRRFFTTDTVYRCLQSAKDRVKKCLSHSNLFDDMGLTYWGPFDGHDEQELERVFALARDYDSPLLIHVVTRKGQGYAPAEQNPVAYHGISPESSRNTSKKASSWSAAAASRILSAAREDSRVVVLTPAMTEGSALGSFKKEFPERFFDVGIAEEHMITFAAGLAAGGMRPVACIYSTFLQRAMDQLVHDVCLQNLPVILAVDRAGLVGEDGETHQGLFDMNWCSVIPNLQVWSPFNESSLAYAFEASRRSERPALIRYPRGAVPQFLLEGGAMTDTRPDSSWCILAVGAACQTAFEASRLAEAKGHEIPSLLFLNRVSPFPEELAEHLKNRRLVVVAEENYAAGGIAERLTFFAAQEKLCCGVVSASIPPVFVAQGTPAQQRARYGLTPERIVELYERQKS